MHGISFMGYLSFLHTTWLLGSYFSRKEEWVLHNPAQPRTTPHPPSPPPKTTKDDWTKLMLPVSREASKFKIHAFH